MTDSNLTVEERDALAHILDYMEVEEMYLRKNAHGVDEVLLADQVRDEIKCLRSLLQEQEYRIDEPERCPAKLCIVTEDSKEKFIQCIESDEHILHSSITGIYWLDRHSYQGTKGSE